MNGHANDSNNDCKKKPTGAARFFPLSHRRLVHRRERRMQLRSAVGVIELQVLHGQDPGDKHWGCPIRESWGLSGHQQLSLALEDKLAFTVTATSSYEEAAAVAQKWGAPVSPSAIHALTQRLGARAEANTQAQLESVPRERRPERAPTKLAVLMLDGWQVRQRGPGWGKKRTQQPRVEWHEWKTGVYYRQEQAGETLGGRGVLEEKIMIGWQGEPVEFGRRCGVDWVVPRPNWWWATARHGSGRWRRTGGLEPVKCWTSITPANISGSWAGPYTATMRRPPPSGLNGTCTDCGMEERNGCWRRWPG